MATYLLADRGFVPTITIVVERQMARRIHYDPVLRIAEDVDFALRLYLAGCRFRMVDEPGAVWMDLADPNRTSAARRDQRFGSWLEQLRPAIPARAYHGGRGWAYAKLVAREHPFAALGLYIGAVLRGCYAPRLAVIVFLQIFLGRRYRRIADHAIRWLKAGLHEPQPSDTHGALEQA
jgi:hypothetical protein